MSASAFARARQFAQLARPFRAQILLWLVYECSKFAFFQLSRRQGLLQGVSVVNLGTLAFGVWLLVLRFVVLFYLPFTLVQAGARLGLIGRWRRLSASVEG